MDEKEIKIVVAQHPNYNGNFVFRVPEGTRLLVGNYVLCNTKRGHNQIGRCITPAFYITERDLIDFYGRTENSLAPVIGWLEPEYFEVEEKKQ